MMKKIILTFLISSFACSLQLTAQIHDTTTNRNMSKDEANSLLLKSKRQKTTGFILLGAAAAAFTTALIIVNNDNNFFDNSFGLEGGLILATGASALASIPFFIASGKNKRKAKMMLKNETIRFDPRANSSNQLVSIGIKINL